MWLTPWRSGRLTALGLTSKSVSAVAAVAGRARTGSANRCRPVGSGRYGESRRSTRSRSQSRSPDSAIEQEVAQAVRELKFTARAPIAASYFDTLGLDENVGRAEPDARAAERMR